MGRMNCVLELDRVGLATEGTHQEREDQAQDLQSLLSLTLLQEDQLESKFPCPKTSSADCPCKKLFRSLPSLPVGDEVFSLYERETSTCRHKGELLTS